MYFDIFASKDALRWFLLKLKEDKELDDWIKRYIRIGLKQRVIMSPCKGPYGEQGKDIVAIENEKTGEYCSYVIKRGTLKQNLYGSAGILASLEKALTIDLELYLHRGKKRTVRVVHNGDEGNRSAIKEFEDFSRNLESRFGNLLLRPNERWNIDKLVERFFPYRKKFKKDGEMELYLDRSNVAYDLIVSFKSEYENLDQISEKVSVDKAFLADKLFQRIGESEDKLGLFKREVKKQSE